MSFVEMKGIKKYFATSRGMLHAVDNVDLEIAEKKTLGIVGESGCGKSTLGRVALCMLKPTAGEIWYDGVELTKLTRREMHNRRTQMQMIFQDPYSSLDPRMSITQAIAEPLTIYKIAKNKDDLSKRVHELMDMVGIAKRFANAYPHELDGGRRQRIGIARALSLNPRFIVCDEPVSALDVSIQAQVINLLLKLQRENNLTYMFITHDLSIVKYVSDEICVMYLGQIVEKCESGELFRNTLHPYSQALLSAILEPSTHKKSDRIILKGELASPINPSISCRFAPRCIHASEECADSEPPLAEVGNNHFVACHKVTPHLTSGK